MIKIWLQQIRAPFLMLSVVLTGVGGAVAFKHHVFQGRAFWLSMLGVVLAHIGVNLFNEVSDHKTGIDRRTVRTPFSGGSGNLQSGRTRPGAVWWAACLAMFAAGVIGMYLAWKSTPWIFAIMAIGGWTAVYYTSHLAKWTLGEAMAGIALGTLVVLGTYLAQAGTLNAEVAWISVSPGILTSLLLLLNEFPDAEADRHGGRRHLVIVLGRKNAGRLYSAAMLLQYTILLWGILGGLFPATLLIVFLTLPLAVKASAGALKPGLTVAQLIPAMGANVGVVLGTNALIMVAYFAGTR